MAEKQPPNNKPDQGGLGSHRHFLYGENAQLNPPDYGGWVSNPEFFDQHSIGGIGRRKNIAVVHSVPSVLARPIIFYQALSNEEHPLHYPVVNEWRGLLGCLALQDIAGLVITQSVFKIDGLVESGDEKTLRNILYRQLPRITQDGEIGIDPQWQEWWVVKEHDRLIGATSPWTIVYTPSSYRCPEELPWQDRKTRLLQDPVTYYGGQNDGVPELLALSVWIGYMLGAKPWGYDDDTQGEVIGTIREELDKWGKDVKRELTKKGVTDLADHISFPKGPPTDNVPQGMKLPYSSFWKSVGGGDAKDSELMLAVSRKPRNRSAAIAFSCGTRGQEVPPNMDGRRVYKNIYGNDPALLRLLSDSQVRSGEVIRDKLKIPNNIQGILLEEEFFPRKLAKLSTSEASFKREDFAVPLTPAFFEWFTFDDLLTGNCKLEWKREGGTLRVTLELPLHGNQKGPLKIEKRYPETSFEPIKETERLALSIWPNFRARTRHVVGEKSFWLNDWKEYLVTALDLSEVGLPVDAWPILESGAVLHETEAQPGVSRKRIWRPSEFPLGFAIYSKGRTAECWGLVLRSNPVVAPELNENNHWGVGIDFGTSNTQVFYQKKGSKSAERLALENRTIHLLETNSGVVDQLNEEQYPSKTVYPQFVTAVSTSAETVFLGDPQSHKHRYMASFVCNPVLVAHKIADRQQEENVKWGGSSSLPAYLHEIQRYVLAEARAKGVGSLDVRWAYPLSLSAASRDMMTTQWDSMGNAYKGMTIKVQKGISESDAVVRCLSQFPELFPVSGHNMALAVDVGGGSTDIGFWRKDKLQDQASLKLAGTDLMTRIASIMSIQEKFAELGGTAYADVKRGFDRMPAVMANVLIGAPIRRALQGQDSKALDEYYVLADRLRRNDEGFLRNQIPWMQARSLIFLFFTGIAYYSGIHAVRKLEAGGEPSLYLGGMASLLLPWLGGKDNLRRLIKEPFVAGIRSAALANEDNELFDRPITPKVSGPAFGDVGVQVKNEVAMGVLQDSLSHSEVKTELQEKQVLKTIVGDTIWSLGDKAVAWHKEVTAEDMVNLEPIPGRSSSLFSGYATWLADAALLEELSLDKDMVTEVASQVISTDQIKTMIRKEHGDGKRGELQPVFGYMLRDLLRRYWEKANPGGK